MELLVLFVVLFFIIGAGLLFLWRRGALSLDHDKAKHELEDAAAHVRKNVRNWRDKLGD